MLTFVDVIFSEKSYINMTEMNTGYNRYLEITVLGVFKNYFQIIVLEIGQT